MNSVIKNKLGLTLLEMMVTIVVGSVVTMILMQILVLTVNARTTLEMENRMLNESYYIAEQIRFSVFEREPQQIEIISSTSTRTEIEIRHLYDFTTNANNEIVPVDNIVIDTLIIDTSNPDDVILTYNGSQLNDANVFLVDGTSVELINIDPACDVQAEACDTAIIRLTLTIRIQLNDGSLLAPQTYITTILV